MRSPVAASLVAPIMVTTATVCVALADACKEERKGPAPCVDDGDCPASARCASSGVCIPVSPCADVVCEPGTQCNAVTGQCAPGGPCGGAVRLFPAAVLFVVDRSCSMDNELGQTGVTKWEAAAAALSSTTGALDDELAFGLTLFPDTAGDRCEQTEVAVAVASDNAGAIEALLTAALDPGHALFPDGPCVTNIDTAMAQAESLLDDDEQEAQVVLVTDGRQANCNEATGEAEALASIARLLDRGIETVVVGFDRAADAAQLDAFARAGGRPNADVDVDFYPATDPAALEATLLQLAEAARDCSLRLPLAPPDPAQLFVFVDGAASAEFSYDEQTRSLALSGAACAALQAGGVERVDVVFGGCSN